MLEQANGAQAGRHHMDTGVTFELPPPRLEPLTQGSRALAELPGRVAGVAAEALGDEDVFVVVRTSTRVDVGSWLGRSRVWLLALAEQFVLLALPRNPLARWPNLARRLGVSTRPYVERIALSRLRGTTYNHVTGELVLAPANAARLRRLKVTPRDGYQLLAQIRHGCQETADA